MVRAFTVAALLATVAAVNPSSTLPSEATLVEGETLTFTLTLPQAPTADVAVRVSSSPAAVRVTPTVVLISAADWATPHTFTVSVDDDFVVSAAEASSAIDFAVNSDDGAYEGAHVPSCSGGFAERSPPHTLSLSPWCAVFFCMGQ